jgi:hypothetical protein
MKARRDLATFLLCSGLLLGGCSTSDASYTEMVRTQIAHGPVEACCAGQEPPDPKCVVEALVKCAYVVGATITTSQIFRLPYDGGAQIESRVVGPTGQGTCHHEIHRKGRKFFFKSGVCSPPEAR